MMAAYELLYRYRRLAEDAIEACDARLKAQPDNPIVILERWHYARMAIRYHAVIERLERKYEH